MKDTEIKVNGKCVGEYDMCPDAPVIFINFENNKSTDRDDDVLFSISIDPDGLLEAFKRNMTLHFICTTNRTPYGNGDYCFELKLPFIKDSVARYPSSRIMELRMGTSLRELGVDDLLIGIRMPFDDYENGRYSCEDTYTYISVPKVGDNKLTPLFKVSKIYATEY